jgi:hypothetical protein
MRGQSAGHVPQQCLFFSFTTLVVLELTLEVIHFPEQRWETVYVWDQQFEQFIILPLAGRDSRQRRMVRILGRRLSPCPPVPLRRRLSLVILSSAKNLMCLGDYSFVTPPNPLLS